MASRKIADTTVDANDRGSQTTGSASPDSGPDVLQTAVTVQSSGSLSAEEKTKILKERALRLAQPPEQDQGGEAFLAVIEFVLAHERYAMDVQYVKEVYPLKDLTSLPCTPSFVLGIINVRGQVVSVVDIKHFFDLPSKEPTDQTKVLIIKNHAMEMGVLADAVVGERKIPLTDIQSDSAMLRGLREQYVRGVTQDRLVVMDVEKFLLDDSLVVHQEVGD
jgi:purine-binding chemotaxis protein CheW